VVHALQASDPHQPLDTTVTDPPPPPKDQLRMHTPNAVGAAGAGMDVPDLVNQKRVVDTTVTRATERHS